MTQNPAVPSKLSFLLEIPAAKVNDLKDALTRAEIPFDPEATIVAVDFHPHYSQTINTGADIPAILDTINAYLVAHEFEPRFATDSDSWPLERKQEFLNFVTLRFDWQDFTPDTPWYELALEPWSAIAARHPGLFEPA